MENATTSPGGAPGAPGPVVAGEKVREASTRLAESARATDAPKGRGRPPTPGSPHSQFKANGAKAAPGEKSNPTGGSQPVLRAGVVERAINSMLSVCDRTVVRKVHNTALILTKEKGLAEQFASEVAMSEEERRDIASLAELVCQQYALAGQHMPAALLVTHLAFYGGRVALTMNQLNKIADYNRQHGAKATPPAEPAKPAP